MCMQAILNDTIKIINEKKKEIHVVRKGKSETFFTKKNTIPVTKIRPRKHYSYSYDAIFTVNIYSKSSML